jgi:hypothetical protein
MVNLKYCAMKLEISLGSNEVQCLLYDSVLEEVVSLKHCALDICDVHTMCVYLQCKLDYVLLFAFQPSVCSPLNHIAKTVSTTPTTKFFVINLHFPSVSNAP